MATDLMEIIMRHTKFLLAAVVLAAGLVGVSWARHADHPSGASMAPRAAFSTYDIKPAENMETASYDPN
jgi:hypothetical protein